MPRRLGLAALLLASLAAPDASQALPGFKKDLNPRRKDKFPRDVYTFSENGLGVYDVEIGTGKEIVVGDRVVVHFDCKFRNLTVFSSRSGERVTGGVPYGFRVGATGDEERALKGMDLGVRGMRVGGQRSVIIPPSLGFGNAQRGEVPPNSELTLDIQVLSVKSE